MADWNSIYSEGKGAAKVWGNTNPGLTALQHTFEQEAKKKQAQEAQYQASIAKIDIGKVRPADRPETLKMYHTIQETYHKMKKTDNRDERDRLAMEMDDQMKDLDMFTDTSLLAQAQELELGKLPLNKPDEISDEFFDRFPKLRSLPISDPRYQEEAQYLTKNAIVPKYDMDMFLKRASGLVTKAVAGKPYTVNEGGFNILYQDEGKLVDKESLAQLIAKELSSSRGLRSTITRSYPGMDPKEAFNNFVEDSYTILQGQEGPKPKVLSTQAPQRATPMSEMDRWRIAHGYNPRAESKSTEGEKVATYRQDWIDRIFQGVPGSGEEFVSIIKGTPGYDENAKIQQLSVKGKIDPNKFTFTVPRRFIEYTDESGTTKRKVLNPQSITIDRTNPADKDALNKFISETTGENINQSQFKTAGGKKMVKSGTKTTQPAKAQQKTDKTATVNDIRSLVGKKGYEGYTEKELIQYYKKLGYTIK